MLWIKAFHIIALVAWFSGLFYLPRLFVYHAEARDRISIDRFKVMEAKLYYYITTPAAILTILLGIILIMANLPGYMHMPWMHMKLTLVLLLMIYHTYLGLLLNDFANERKQHSPRFYRILNEMPTFFLITIVILVVVKPFGVMLT